MGRAIHGRFTIMLHSPTSSNYRKGACSGYGFAALSEEPAVQRLMTGPCQSRAGYLQHHGFVTLSGSEGSPCRHKEMLHCVQHDRRTDFDRALG